MSELGLRHLEREQRDGPAGFDRGVLGDVGGHVDFPIDGRAATTIRFPS